MLRASGCGTEPLYCTLSSFQVFHRYGIAHRRAPTPVVRRVEVVAERGVADACQRVGAAEALVHRVEATQRVVLAAAQHGEDGVVQRALAAAPRPPGSRGRAPCVGEAVEFQGFHAVFISAASSSGAKLPGDMSVKACMAGPPSMRMARVLPSRVTCDLARVAGGAGDVEHLLADARVEMLREADGQLVGIGGARRRIDEEAVAAQVIGCGESFARPRHFEIHEPAVTQRAFRSALAAGRFPAACSKRAVATRRSDPRPSPGRARHIHRRVRARERL